jgi:hypothetical protein
LADRTPHELASARRIELPLRAVDEAIERGARVERHVARVLVGDALRVEQGLEEVDGVRVVFGPSPRAHRHLLPPPDLREVGRVADEPNVDTNPDLRDLLGEHLGRVLAHALAVRRVRDDVRVSSCFCNGIIGIARSPHVLEGLGEARRLAGIGFVVAGGARGDRTRRGAERDGLHELVVGAIEHTRDGAPHLDVVERGKLGVHRFAHDLALPLVGRERRPRGVPGEGEDVALGHVAKGVELAREELVLGRGRAHPELEDHPSR